MPIIYTFSQISNMSIFSLIDFTTFNDFQILITIIGFNSLFYLFLIFFCSLLYKTICRICSYIF